MALDYRLKEFFLSEDLLNEEGELNYNATFNGEKFKVVVDVNKNPSKKGIKVKFYPVNEEGMVISNLTPEEIDTLQNSLATTISKKFIDFGLEFDRDTDAPDKQAANFQIPLDSVFTFIRDKVLGSTPENDPEEEVPADEENA
jgi:hypothetical protein